MKLFICFVLVVHLTLKIVSTVDSDLRDEVRYLKLNTLKQLENLNKKMEWSMASGSNPTTYPKGGAPKYVIPKDCAHLQALKMTYSPTQQLEDGVYGVAAGGHRRPVYCDLTTDGGGWTVIQRRIDGSDNFNRSWGEYKRGFGDTDGNYWLGNDRIHNMTNGTASSLRIDMWDWENGHYFATYIQFHISGEATNYRLYVFGHEGRDGDSMTSHNDKPFSTYDKYDHAEANCPKKWGGGWWFRNCYHSFLNGFITNDTSMSWKRAQWRDLGAGEWRLLKKVEMKIRPINFDRQ